jgi:hypothetical protein
MRTSFIVTSALALASVEIWAGTAAAQVCELGDQEPCEVRGCPGMQTCTGTPLHPHWGTCVKDDPQCVPPKTVERAVWRPSTCIWYIDDGVTAPKAWGQAGDVPVPGD